VRDRRAHARGAANPPARRAARLRRRPTRLLARPWTCPVSVAVARVLDGAFGGDAVKAPTLGGSVPMHLFDRLGLPVIAVPIVTTTTASTRTTRTARRPLLGGDRNLCARSRRFGGRAEERMPEPRIAAALSAAVMIATLAVIATPRAQSRLRSRCRRRRSRRSTRRCGPAASRAARWSAVHPPHRGLRQERPAINASSSRTRMR